MALSEFQLIRQFFATPQLAFGGPEVVLGPGDDGALLQLPAAEQLVVSVDTLNAGVHFLADAPPELIAQRSLRVNVSDLAAMGAQPVGFTLALSLPEADAAWLQAFASGLSAAAIDLQCPLVGGDTSRGPLAVTIQVLGKVPQGKALLRSGAQPGDAIYVTGSLGDAAAALQVLIAPDSAHHLSELQRKSLLDAYYQPASRVRIGQAVRGLASAALDISDGLASDLPHILQASGSATGPLGARLYADRLPLSDAFCALIEPPARVGMALGGGDDYELCLCVPPEHQALFERTLMTQNCPVHCIGEVTDDGVVQLIDAHGGASPLPVSGYQHFLNSERENG